MSGAIIYPGTFDPITLGHIDLVDRAASLFESVILAVAASTRKETLFSLEERVLLAKNVLKKYDNVSVCSFTGLLTQFAIQNSARLILRGLRSASDFEYEYQLAGMNRKIAPSIETIFMTPSDSYIFLSASLVREVAELGGDVTHFVHPIVKQALTEKYNRVT